MSLCTFIFIGENVKKNGEKVKVVMFCLRKGVFTLSMSFLGGIYLNIELNCVRTVSIQLFYISMEL